MATKNLVGGIASSVFDQNMKRKTTNLALPCTCVGGRRSCGSLRIINYDNGDFEFKTTKDKAVFLNAKSIKKLIKFLN